MLAAYIGYLAGIISGGVQLVLFLRWLHRRMRDDEIARVFLKDMATRQLPYLHQSMRTIAEASGVELPDPPRIQYIDFSNGRARLDSEYQKSGGW